MCDVIWLSDSTVTRLQTSLTKSDLFNEAVVGNEFGTNTLFQTTQTESDFIIFQYCSISLKPLMAQKKGIFLAFIFCFNIVRQQQTI